MKTSRSYLEAITTALTTETGIKLIEGQGWSTDIKKKTLTYDPYDLLNQSPLASKGFILHEIGHIKHTEVTEVTEVQKKYPNQMQSIYNALEDIRIEGRMVAQYGPFAQEALSAIHVVGANGLKTEMSPLNKVLFSVLLINASKVATIGMSHSLLTRKGEAIYQNESDKIKDIISQLYGYINYIKDLPSNKALKQFVDNTIYPLIKDLLDPEDAPPEESVSLSHRRSVGDCEENPTINTIPEDSELRAMFKPYVNTVSRKLMDILKETYASRFRGSHLSGKLLSKNAYKVISGESRLFSRKNVVDKPNYTVTLALDQSGSMHGARHAATYMGAFMLNEIFKKLGFKVNVIQFNLRILPDKTLEGYRKFQGGGNHDLLMAQEIEKTTDKHDKNLVFILTDGGVYTDPRDILLKLRKLNYDIYAIGIGLEGSELDLLREYYKVTIEASDLSKLPETLINVLKRTIHR